MLRVGILGCAKIAVRSLIPAFFEHPRFILVGIASRTPAKAVAQAERFACTPTDYDGLVTAKDIDLIYVPLPTGLHAEWVEKCLQAGKHVLCEKSLATSQADVERLVSIARHKQLLLIENFQFRFHSQHRLIRSMVDSGAIGELRCFRSSFGFPPFSDRSDIRYSLALGGGALLDAGAYTLKAASFILGNSVRVIAASLCQPRPSEVDLGGGAYLVSDIGVMGQVSFGFDHFYQCNYELWGSKGHLIAKRAFTAPPGFEPEVLLSTRTGTESIKLPADDHFANMLTHCADCIDTKSFEHEYVACLTQSSLIQQTRDLSLSIVIAASR
jgi:predicted dehydrogenase